MSEARATIDGLSKEFDRSVIQTKPGSAKKPATKYVSHGSVTKRLNAVCPGWSSRVVETYTYVNPAGLLVCAGVLLELAIPGVGSRQEFGTANQPRNFGDDAKNAASDALKRAAMRFGVALDLWEDMDEHDEDAAAYPPQGRTLDEALSSGIGPWDRDHPAPARNAAPAFATPRAAPAPAPSVPADSLAMARQHALKQFGPIPATLPDVEAQLAPLAKQVRTNDESLSPGEYQRYHDLEAKRKELLTAAPAAVYDEHLTWTDLWSWARPRGFRSKAEVAAALRKPDSVVNDWTPAEIRTALEVLIEQRARENQPASIAG